jgi:hypothetical protein
LIKSIRHKLPKHWWKCVMPSPVKSTRLQ